MGDNAIQIFSYNGKEVRTTEINGDTWFIAKDVCDILEISNHRDATSNLDDDEKGVAKIDTLGGMQNMTVINESGLYTLLMRSNKEEAKPFRRWVTHDVLPSIRKTGSYSVNGNNALPSGILEGAKLIYETAGITGNQAALALDRVYRSYTGISALQAGKITLTAPTHNQLLTPTEIGKNFGLSSHRVNEILAGAGLQHKIYGRWEALPLGERYAVMVDVGKRHGRGTPVRQLKWDSSILAVFHTFMK